MNNTFEAIQSLPNEYRDRIAVHCIPGDSDQLAKALDAALKCFSDLHKKNFQGLTKEQKQLGSTLELIRTELAAELLRLDGFDFKAAKERGKAEADKPKASKPNEWSQPVAYA